MIRTGGKGPGNAVLLVVGVLVLGLGCGFTTTVVKPPISEPLPVAGTTDGRSPSADAGGAGSASPKASIPAAWTGEFTFCDGSCTRAGTPLVGPGQIAVVHFLTVHADGSAVYETNGYQSKVHADGVVRTDGDSIGFTATKNSVDSFPPVKEGVELFKIIGRSGGGYTTRWEAMEPLVPCADNICFQRPR